MFMGEKVLHDPSKAQKEKLEIQLNIDTKFAEREA
jgi:hypothetical protein